MATSQDSMVAGLFATPEQYQQAQRAQVQAQLAQEAQMDPYAKVSYLAGMSGYGLGKLAGGLLGVEDPQMKLQSFRQQVLRGVDQTDPESLAQASYALNREGDTAGARQLAQLAQAAALNQSQVTKNNREGRAAANKVVEANGRQYLVDSTTGVRIADLGSAANKGANIKEIGVAAKTREPVYFDVTTDSQFTIKPDPANPGKQIRVPFNGGVDRTTSSTNVGFSPEIKMTNQELDWRKQFLSENKPVIEQAANVQQSLNLLQQSQTSPFADAAFANTVVSAFGGDKQKSKSEIDRLVKAGSLDERVANTVKGFFEGTTSAKTKEDQLKVLTAVDKILEQRYNNSAKSWNTRLTAAKVNPELVVPGYGETVGSVSSNVPVGKTVRNKAGDKFTVNADGTLTPVGK